MREIDHTGGSPGRSNAWKWGVCVLLLLATMLNYMDRQTLSLTAKDIYHQFGHSPTKYGFTESSFAVAFALGALLTGWMADRWNIFWIYPAAVVVWSLAGFVTGFVNGWIGLMVCRFLLGLAEAGHWPCALRTTQHLLPAAQRSLGNGLLQSGATIGAIITPFVVVALVQEPADWPYPFWVVGGLGMTWVILWLLWVRPADLPSPRSMDRRGPPPSLMSSLQFMTDRRYWVLVVVVVSINTAWHFFRAWLPQILEDLGYGRNESRLFNSAFYLAADAGSLFVGFTTLYIAHQGRSVHGARVLMFGACTLLTLLGVVVAFLPQSPLVLVLLLVIAFGSLGLFPNYYSYSQDLTVRHQGKVNGTLGCINWLAMAGMQAVVGLLVEWTGYHAVGMILASLAPLAGLVALVFFWRAPSPGVGYAGPLKDISSDAVDDRAR
jgi:ACS family hexuronate transporter-like MFS transporter